MALLLIAVFSDRYNKNSTQEDGEGVQFGKERSVNMGKSENGWGVLTIIVKEICIPTRNQVVDTGRQDYKNANWFERRT